MVGKIAYYLIIIPFSHLPLFVLYRLADLMYLLLITVLPYRRKVIRQNIAWSFPSKSKKERKLLERKFYRYFSNLMMESVKGLSISKKSLLNRIKIENPEVMQDLYSKGKDVLLVGGHYNNWEWLILAQDLIFDHKAIGVGKPLSNKFFNEKFNARRERFGMTVTNNKELKDCFNKYLNKKKPAAVLLLADQSPGDSLKSYWMDFLNKLTPVIYGPEYLAVKYDTAVVFMEMKRTGKGNYSLKLEKLVEAPRETSWGEITVAHTRAMEKVILDKPEFWIWSHKRWKRTLPPDMESLVKSQQNKFQKLIANVTG